jgi:hypothetical protein
MSDDKGLVRLNWRVDPRGYKIVKGGWCRGREYAEDYLIRPIGGETNEDRLIEAGLLEHEIFRDLANSAARQPVHDGVLEFVNKWGPLTRFRPTVASFLRAREAIARAIDYKYDKLSDVIWSDVRHRMVGGHLMVGKLGLGLGRLEARLAIRRGRQRLYFEASSLLQFCILELLHAQDGSIDVVPCQSCGKILPLHREGRPKKYCGEVCKMAAWRTAHGDEINRARRERRASGKKSRAA